MTYAKHLSKQIFKKTITTLPTRKGYGEGLVAAGKKNSNVVVLCCDLTESTWSHLFAKAFPERFIEMGVAEQNMAGVASGLALEGKIRSWQAKAEAESERVRELEKLLAAAKEEAQRAERASADEVHRSRAQEMGHAAELKNLRGGMGREINEEHRARAAERGRMERELREGVEALKAERKDLERSWTQERIGLDTEIQKWRRRAEERSSQVADLNIRLAALEKSLAPASEIAARERDLEAGRRELAEEYRERQEELERLKKQFEQDVGKLLRRELAEEYRERQEELERLKKQFEQDVAKLLRQYRG